MEPIDAFFQELDSERLLQQHGQALVDDARQLLADQAAARVAGVIVLPDSRDAQALRTLVAQIAGREPPKGLLVCIVPRAMVEPILNKMVGDVPWREEPWQPQQTLPIVVSTRDGFRFGFHGLANTDGAGSG